jgi:hypothetical protein
VPSQVSSENRVPSPTTKEPCLRKVSLWCINPFQKGESVGLAWTSAIVFVFKYLLHSSSYHIPSSLMILNNHLLKRQLFLTSRTSMPKPPWSFDRQTMFHFVSLYFFFVLVTLPKETRAKKVKPLPYPYGYFEEREQEHWQASWHRVYED